MPFFFATSTLNRLGSSFMDAYLGAHGWGSHGEPRIVLSGAAPRRKFFQIFSPAESPPPPRPSPRMRRSHLIARSATSLSQATVVSHATARSTAAAPGDAANEASSQISAASVGAPLRGTSQNSGLPMPPVRVGSSSPPVAESSPFKPARLLLEEANAAAHNLESSSGPAPTAVRSSENKAPPPSSSSPGDDTESDEEAAPRKRPIQPSVVPLVEAPVVNAQEEDAAAEEAGKKHRKKRQSTDDAQPLIAENLNSSTNNNNLQPGLEGEDDAGSKKKKKKRHDKDAGDEGSPHREKKHKKKDKSDAHAEGEKPAKDDDQKKKKKKESNEEAPCLPLPTAEPSVPMERVSEPPAPPPTQALSIVETISRSHETVVEDLPKSPRAAPVVVAHVPEPRLAEQVQSVRKPREKKKPWMESVGAVDDAEDSKTQTQEDLVRRELERAGVCFADEDGRFACESTARLAAHLRELGSNRATGFCNSFAGFLADDAVLARLLAPLRVAEASGSEETLPPSLLRVLLGVRTVQARVIPIVMDLFLSKSLEDKANDDVPKRLLAQLKMLDHVWDSRAMAESIFSCMHSLCDTNSPWLRELISALPEILSDSEHASAVEHLLQMLRENRDLAAPIIDALMDLTTPKSLLQELVDTVLDVIKTAPVQVVPVAVRFLLRTTGEDEAIEGAGMVTKIVERLAYIGQANADAEALTIKELHHGLLLRPAVAHAYLQLLKEAKVPHTVADVWLLIALRTSPQHVQQATLAFKRLVNKTDESYELLKNAIIGHRVALEQFFLPLLDMAAAFVRASALDKQIDALRTFGAHIYRLLFIEFSDARCRQEVALNLAIHCGAGPTCKDEVDVALRCLRRMVRSDEEATALAPFSSYVRSLLADLERYDKSQARMLFRVVGRLAQVDGDGFDEVKILLRKLLGSCEPSRQMLGIVGSIQMAAIVAPSRCASSFLDSQPVETETSSGGRMDLYDALELVDVMMRETRASGWAVTAFLYDEVAVACESGSLHSKVKESFGANVSRSFEAHVIDVKAVETVFGGALTPVELFALDRATANKAVIQILPLLNEAQTSTQSLQALNTMCPMARCMLASTSPEDELDAVLGCALSLPSPAVLDHLATRSAVVREAVCCAFFYASNWMRQVVGAFAKPTADEETKSKVCQRLVTLVQVEGYLSRAVAAHLSFTPPVGASEVLAKSNKAPSRSSGAGAKGKKPSKIGKAPKKSKAVVEDGDAGAGEEEAEEADPADKSARASAGKVIDEATAVANAKKCLRELSPNVCSVLKFNNLQLRFVGDDEKALDKKNVCVTVPALRVVVETLCEHLSHRLGASKRTSSQSVLYEIETMELTALAVDVLPTLRVFCDELAQCAAGKKDVDLTASEATDTIAILGATAQCLSVLLRYTHLRTSRKGEMLLLSALRAFSQEPRQLTAASGLSFTTDAPVRTDTALLLAQASKQAMFFFYERVARSGALSISLDVHMTVFMVIKELAAFHKSTSGSSEDEARASVTGDVVKLAKSMLRSDWKAPAGLQQPKYAKGNLSVLVQTFLENGANVLEAASAMVDEVVIRCDVGLEKVDAASAGAVKYPSLSLKTVHLFYGPALASLTKGITALDGDDLTFIEDVQRVALAFKKAILLTQRVEKTALYRDAVKNGRAFLAQFMKKCAPAILDARHEHAEAALQIFSNMQGATRQLQAVCGHGQQVKDPTILGHTPALRKLLQSFVFAAVTVLKENSNAQVTTGLLRLRNVDGSKAKDEAAEQ